MLRKFYILLCLVFFVSNLFAKSTSPFEDVVFSVDFSDDSIHDATWPSTVGKSNNLKFCNVKSLPFSNGRAAVFDGKNSYIFYDLGTSAELKIETSLTYHIRVKYDRLIGESFLMGRFGNNRVSLISTFNDNVSGFISPDGINSIGHSVEEKLSLGKF